MIKAEWHIWIICHLSLVYSIIYIYYIELVADQTSLKIFGFFFKPPENLHCFTLLDILSALNIQETQVKIRVLLLGCLAIFRGGIKVAADSHVIFRPVQVLMTMCFHLNLRAGNKNLTCASILPCKDWLVAGSIRTENHTFKTIYVCLHAWYPMWIHPSIIS